MSELAEVQTGEMPAPSGEISDFDSADAAVPEWARGLTGEDAAYLRARGWQTPADLLRHHRGLEAMVGPDQVRIPDAEAGPEAKETFWSRLGRPSTPAGYELSPGETATGYDTALADWFREAAHAVNLPADMAQALHDRFLEQRHAEGRAAWEAQEERRQAQVETLRRDWGRAYDANLAAARQAVGALGGQPLKDALEESGLGDHPVLVKAFAAAGHRLFGTIGGPSTAAGAEATAVSPAAPAALTATDAQREIMRLRSDPRFMAAYGDRGHPGHAAAQARRDELYAVGYPPAADTDRRNP